MSSTDSNMVAGLDSSVEIFVKSFAGDVVQYPKFKEKVKRDVIILQARCGEDPHLALQQLRFFYLFLEFWVLDHVSREAFHKDLDR